ncbi:MAG: hypothetical protein NTU83_15485, partial [Candidatus Hydrogenedentes bacterium]|nr:hypothetical protein [Candidatus Hydrogenedentota bacterium]
CNGLIDEVRLSRSVRTIDSTPGAELASDELTIGLWHFAADAVGKDASSLVRDGLFKARQIAFTESGIELPGGRPTE